MDKECYEIQDNHKGAQTFDGYNINIVESGFTNFVTMTPTAVAPHLEGYRHLL